MLAKQPVAGICRHCNGNLVAIAQQMLGDGLTTQCGTCGCRFDPDRNLIGKRCPDAPPIPHAITKLGRNPRYGH